MRHTTLSNKQEFILVLIADVLQNKCLCKSVNFLPTDMVPRSRKKNKWSKPTRFQLWNRWAPKQAVLFVILSRKENAEVKDVFLGEKLSCPSFKQYPWKQTRNNGCDISARFCLLTKAQTWRSGGHMWGQYRNSRYTIYLAYLILAQIHVVL